MKFRVDRDVLAEAVAWAARVLPARPAIPVLSGLLLEARPEQEDLVLSAFDYDVSARASVEAEVAEPGRVLIPGRVLAEITRSLPGKAVEVVADGSEATLTCGSAEFNLRTMPVEDFPTLPAMPPVIGAIGGGVFASAVGQVAPAASRDETLPMLTGVRVDISGEHVTMAATDRYRIAAREFDWRPERPDAAAAAVVPARVLVEVARSLRGGEVAVALGDGIAGFESVGRSTTVRLLDEQFIDYRARLAGDWSIRADVRVAPFVEAIKRIRLVAEPTTAIRLSFGQGQVTIQAGGGEVGRGTEVLDAELSGGDIQIAFQSQFLLDGLSGIESEFVRLNMESPTRPALITEVPGDAVPAFRYLVMSLRQA
ncbi:DNA polymerase III subunit beta [Planomonospora parontospora subsp. parontospora]|uniref:Beta sliding clamp n=2 Tax=Planomonospora parontospora TaxID=58119 RepID=A0AA37F3L5_9ACTN|nr:DNA polymerase III subunit beta [Planomonospora parontospora]GGK60201.1 DNA polymerase III subunit beta [Planomonospora parontospora]GII08801.1 DNA polymerase III subunit beta [Planomonospora parontospora subsp. parontospora]